MRVSPSLLSVVHAGGRIASAATVWVVPTAIFGSIAACGVFHEINLHTITLKKPTRIRRVELESGSVIAPKPDKVDTIMLLTRVEKKDLQHVVRRTCKWLAIATTAYAAMLVVSRGKESFSSLGASARTLGDVMLHCADGVVVASAWILLNLAGQPDDNREGPTARGIGYFCLGGLYFALRGMVGIAEAVSPGCRMQLLRKLGSPLISKG